MTRVLLLMVTAAGAARPEIQRRRFLAAAAASTAAPADASGLLLLPPTKPLTNRYVLVRAGESRSEADGVIETNAARKFLFSNGLTEEGAKQASAAADAVARVFGDAGGPPVVRYATARHCKQTADILGARLAVPSSKLLPEADLLDARGYGAHEGEGLWRVPELWAQYDAKSRYAKPPEAEDGSYAESVEDVYVRVREVLSVCETTLCDDLRGNQTVRRAHPTILH